jgi:hypothetical protein
MIECDSQQKWVVLGIDAAWTENPPIGVALVRQAAPDWGGVDVAPFITLVFLLLLTAPLLICRSSHRGLLCESNRPGLEGFATTGTQISATCHNCFHTWTRVCIWRGLGR